MRHTGDPALSCILLYKEKLSSLEVILYGAVRIINDLTKCQTMGRVDWPYYDMAFTFLSAMGCYVRPKHRHLTFIPGKWPILYNPH